MQKSKIQAYSVAVSRSFDFTVDSSATVEQIHSAFGERDYWLARLKKFGSIGRLDTLTVDTDGCVTTVVVHDLRPDGLPGPVTKFFPKEFQIVQQEIWRAIGGGRVRGEVSVVPHGAPGSWVGTALITPRSEGSQLKCAATAEFKVPLVGGKIESLMGRMLVQNISVVQRFTAEWITSHA
ncbi:DUF2505 domain-containing protein [Mycolicibacterium peregrinum]|uniref:DUF2505 domain-containing protein n=1 Tax=Mycolicibacterium peregrinum TaxID=43304 RepID=UPI001F40997A|nr:DUF2505 domain-containing protein [Mycolicibacterium peregrinum]